MQVNTTSEGELIKLVGFMVGNGATNWDFDASPSFPDTVYGFNLITKTDIDYFHDNNCTFYLNDFRNHTGPAECQVYWDKM